MMKVMGAAGVPEEAPRALRKLEHSIANGNRSLRKGNAVQTAVVAQLGEDRHFNIFLRGLDHLEKLQNDREEESSFEVDEEYGHFHGGESEGDDYFSSIWDMKYLQMMCQNLRETVLCRGCILCSKTNDLISSIARSFSIALRYMYNDFFKLRAFVVYSLIRVLSLKGLDHCKAKSKSESC
jgi:hypothetical protein